MNIFISWSKDRSKAIAAALNDWLPHVIQRSLKPWMSASDIEPGQRWSQAVAEQLATSTVGIFCLTPENLNNPWILFEAGAISKTFGEAIVCPYIHDMQAKEISGPLSQFQASTTDKEGTRTLLYSINKALAGDALDKEFLDKQFNKWWPDLKKEFKKIPTLELDTARPMRDDVLRHTSKALKEISRQ
jgi:hypothetical protein